MARLGPNPVFRYFDTSGNLLEGGKVYTYESGASTVAKPTYADYELSIKRRNPVILDSRGEAEMYLETGSEYRFVITDKDDVTLRTVDNINALSSSDKIQGDMDVNGNSIVSSSNGDIAFTADGIGNIVLDGLDVDLSTNTNGYVLVTDGAGTISLEVNGPLWQYDATPQLGGALDTNSHNITFNSSNGIHDDSDNEQLLFTTTSNAVNYLEITNAATGAGPTLGVGGDNTNIGLALKGKGSGAVSLSGLDYPTSDGSTLAPLATNGSGVLSFGLGSQATKAIMEAATDTVFLVPTDTMIHHPGAAKGWVQIDYAATVVDSYNVSSVVDGPLGEYTITWSTAFSSANYVVDVRNFANLATSGEGSRSTVIGQAAGTVTTQSWKLNAAAAATSFTALYITAYGESS